MYCKAEAYALTLKTTTMIFNLLICCYNIYFIIWCRLVVRTTQGDIRFEVHNIIHTHLGQLHELLRWRHHTLRLNFTDETVGDVSVAIVQQLAYYQSVQVLSVFQSWFRSKHVDREPGSSNQN